MNAGNTLTLATLLGAALTSSSCSVQPKPNPNQEKVLKAAWVNPYPEGSYAHFVAEPGYPETYKVYRDKNILARTNGKNARLMVSLSTQRAILYAGSDVAMDYPIASGKRTFPTPPGDYKIMEKVRREKRSNLYGKIYDAEGKVFKTDAEFGKDEIPEGGNFKGASMPYWLRLSWDGIGMHQGQVPRRPASHGCVRMPSSVASTIFSKTGVGTPVSIVK